MTELALNPRWVNYARLHGLTPDDQLAHDRERWKGGSMCGFMLWGRAMLAQFGRAHPEAFIVGQLVDHEAYDRWLDAQQAARYVVHGGNALCYRIDDQPWMLGVLAGDVFKQGPDWKNGPIAITDEIVPATLADFERFRVCPEGHL